MRGDERGFTLIEMVVGMFLLAIFLAAAEPLVVQALRQGRDQAVAHRVQAADQAGFRQMNAEVRQAIAVFSVGPTQVTVLETSAAPCKYQVVQFLYPASGNLYRIAYPFSKNEAAGQSLLTSLENFANCAVGGLTGGAYGCFGTGAVGIYGANNASSTSVLADHLTSLQFKIAGDLPYLEESALVQDGSAPAYEIKTGSFVRNDAGAINDATTAIKNCVGGGGD